MLTKFKDTEVLLIMKREGKLDNLVNDKRALIQYRNLKTGLLDPLIEVRPINGQIDDLIREIHDRIEKNERVFITTLTKKMSEDVSFLSDYDNSFYYFYV